MEDQYLTVFCTFPDLESARRVIGRLVESKLIACGNLLAGAESIYRWKGEIERSSEVLAILKTTSDKFPPLECAFKELHPYELPELIATQVSRGSQAYLSWISENVS